MTEGKNQKITEHGSFTPLVFLAAGGMGPSTTIAYKCLAALLAEKRGQKYSLVHDDVAETQAFVQPPAICKHCNQRPQDCKIHKLPKSTQQTELAAAEGHIPSALHSLN